MRLNIKSEETCRLAAELAELTGETKTFAITVALRERLDRERREHNTDVKLHEMRVIAKRCAALVGPGSSSQEHGDELYDEHGVPH